jgi:hypothetical protein
MKHVAAVLIAIAGVVSFPLGCAWGALKAGFDKGVEVTEDFARRYAGAPKKSAK